MGCLCNKSYIERPNYRRRSTRHQTCTVSIKSLYKIGKILGTGSFGIVRIGWPKSNLTHKVAIKTIDKSLVKNLDKMRVEVEILVGLDHPNIVRLYESFEDDRYFHIVMELCEGGELWDSISSKGHYEEKDAAEIMKKILRVVNHLHKTKICHRDLKPENFMFDSKEPDAELKLIDFGLSQKFGNNWKNMKTVVGTPYYVAPEVLRGSYGCLCDMWSVGVIMFVLMCGEHPFLGNNQGELYSKIMKGKYEFSSNHWSKVSSQAKDLVSKMLVLEPKHRITAEQALKHPWFGFTESNKINLNPTIADSLRHFKISSNFQKEILAYVVNELTHEQIKDLKEAFNSIDTQKNGFITLSDLMAVLLTSDDSPRIKEIEAAFRNLDFNQDGKINYSEFLTGTLATKNVINEEKLWSAFRHFDPNNTGKITAASLRSALKRAGKLNIDASQLISEVDNDQDGEISFDEFKRIVEGK